MPRLVSRVDRSTTIMKRREQIGAFGEVVLGNAQIDQQVARVVGGVDCTPPVDHFVVHFPRNLVAEVADDAFEFLTRFVVRQRWNRRHRIGKLSQPVLLLSGRLGGGEVSDNTAGLLGVLDALERPGAPPSQPVACRFQVDPAVGDLAVACDLDRDKLTAVGFVGLYVAVPGGWHNGIAFRPIRRFARWIGRARFLVIFSNVNTRKWASKPQRRNPLQ